MPWETPIFDRTVTDVNERTAKGHYNVSDVERVNGNTQYLATELAPFGYVVTLLAWTVQTKASIGYASLINRLSANVQSVADAYLVPVGWNALSTTWSATSNPKFYYENANDLEENLYLLKLSLDTFAQQVLYCGEQEAVCGDLNTQYNQY